MTPSSSSSRRSIRLRTVPSETFNPSAIVVAVVFRASAIRAWSICLSISSKRDVMSTPAGSGVFIFGTDTGTVCDVEPTE